MQKVEILPPLSKETFKGAARIALSQSDGRTPVVIAMEFSIEARPSLDADGGMIVGLHLHSCSARAV